MGLKWNQQVWEIFHLACQVRYLLKARSNSLLDDLSKMIPGSCDHAIVSIISTSAFHTSGYISSRAISGSYQKAVEIGTLCSHFFCFFSLLVLELAPSCWIVQANLGAGTQPAAPSNISSFWLHLILDRPYVKAHLFHQIFLIEIQPFESEELEILFVVLRVDFFSFFILKMSTLKIKGHYHHQQWLFKFKSDDRCTIWYLPSSVMMIFLNCVLQLPRVLHIMCWC